MLSPLNHVVCNIYPTNRACLAAGKISNANFCDNDARNDSEKTAMSDLEDSENSSQDEKTSSLSENTPTVSLSGRNTCEEEQESVNPSSSILSDTSSCSVNLYSSSMSISLTDSSTTSETDPDSTTFSLTDPSSMTVTHPELFDPSNSVMDLSDRSSSQSQLSTPTQNGPQTFSITESPRQTSINMTTTSPNVLT